MTEQEFFTVHHNLTATMEPMESNFALPSQIQFESEIPAPFVVASEFSQLDLLADSARAELKNSDLKNVTSLLDAQNSKLNLLLSFMLSQQDDEKFRTHTYSFGASQFSCFSNTDIEPGRLVSCFWNTLPQQFTATRKCLQANLKIQVSKSTSNTFIFVILTKTC